MPKTREQLMDLAAQKTFAEMDAVNSNRLIEYRIMNEPDQNPLAPKPSERNRAPGAFSNNELTFSQAGEARHANSPFMWARRRYAR
jgi:hypothetical protein